MTDDRDVTRAAGAEVLSFDAPESIEAEAHRWMIRLDDEPTIEDREAFKQWVNQSNEHRAAFEDVIGFSAEMDLVSQIVLPRERVSLEKGGASVFSGWGAFRHLATASCLVLALAVLVLPGNPDEVYMTAIGEQKTVELEDGSWVLLNTNSRLRVDYHAEYRRLVLERGEAHFDVAHNKARPFEVYAGEGLVRAIGTAFSIHLRTRQVGVLVTEGIVEIDSIQPNESSELELPSDVEAVSRSAPKARGMRVNAGHLLVYDRELITAVETAAVEQMDEQLSWHDGTLVFDGESLEQVVAAVSRYTQLKIIIPQKKTRALEVGGVFKIGDIESFLDALERGFEIEVKEVTPGKVVKILYKEKS